LGASNTNIEEIKRADINQAAALKVFINDIGSTQVNSPILRLIFSTIIFSLFFFSAHSSIESIRHFVISTSCTKIYLHF